ncbi:MAG: HAD-IIA family hydrolase [Actinobacteria bacterium]|nr:HAD-IIA family hydrolase [Actinomycetota bacterium]MBO0834857.1 HAD-IIA family hydrolase [Actinomycetota bacterium]
MTGRNRVVAAESGPHGRGSPRTSPQACAGPLSSYYDAALLDLDGVVYLGGTPIAGAAAALTAAARAGMKLAYVTNNASRTPHGIAGQLVAMGVPATAADIVTSAQAAAHLLADRLPAGSPVLVVGGAGLRQAVRERGLRPVTSAGVGPLAVVQGYAPDISYGLLAEATYAINGGAWYVLSNADPTLPTPRGAAPGNGSLAQVLIHATGVEPVVAGKPEPPLHTESVQRVGAKRPLVVGDRLDTDIEGAFRGGTDSLLVLTGVTSPADLLLAAPEHRPPYVSIDLGGLNASHPAVTAVNGGFSCGGWTAALGTGEGWLAVTGGGEWIDALRTLCAAAWTAGPPQGTPQEQRRAAEIVLAAIGPAR